ncbi:MAG: sensor histidine kinase [Pseudonocardiaceae bacterium]
MRGLLHDLGRDLAAISYLVELVRGSPDLDDTTRHRVGLIELEMKRLTELVRDEVVKEPEPEILSVRPILEQIISLATIPNDTQVCLVAGDDVRMRIDGSFLRRMVGNVLDNAIRAAGPRGHVQVTVAGGPDVVIEVTDDGPGFGNASDGSASLGLGIVAELAKACGGSLQVRSTEPLGTRVRLMYAGLGVATAEGIVSDDGSGAR